MRIRELYVEGFGGLNHLLLSLHPELNLILGQNEAGKTCLMEFIRALLFGLTKRDKSFERYKPLSQEVYGGRMVIDVDGEEMVVTARFPGSPKIGEGGEEALGDFQGLLGRILYSRVFSLGLAEVSNLDLLGEEEVARRLYSASLGPLGRAYGLVLERLERGRDALFKPTGHKPVINSILREIKEVNGELKRLKELPTRYHEILQEMDILDGKLKETQADWMRIRKETEECKRLVQAHPIYCKLREIQEMMAGSELPGSFPSKGLERLDEIEKELTQVERELRDVRSTLAPLEKRLEGPWENRKFLGMEEEIGVLRERWGVIKRGTRRLAELDKTLSVLQEEIGKQTRYLGMGEHLPPLPTATVWERLRTFTEEFSELDKKELRLEKTLELKDDERRVKEASLRATEANRPSAPLLTWETLEKRWETLRDAREHLHRMPPRWAGVTILIVLFGGVAGVLAGLYIHNVLIQMGGIMAVMGSITGLLWMSAKSGKWKKKARQLVSELELADLSSLAMDGAERNLKEAEENLRTLEQWEERRREEERLLGLISKEIGELKIHMEELEKEKSGLNMKWREWISELGLPSKTSPNGARDMLQKLEELHIRLQEKRRLEREKEDISEEIENFKISMVSSLEKLRIPFSTMEEGMVHLTKGLEDAQKEQKERSSLETRILPLKTKEDLLERRRVQLKQAMDELLESAGADSLSGFREMAHQWKNREELIREARDLRTKLAAILGADWERYTQQMEKMKPGEAQERVERLDERGKEIQEERDGLIHHRGELQREKRKMEGEKREQELLQKREELLEKLEEAAHRWTVDTMSIVLFKRTREVYERNNQPRVLREASRFFSTMTGRRYVRVFLPIGEKELWVERQGEGPISSKYLSRGTSEQLYLSISMAFMLDMRDKALALPVVLDDVLVNFDPERGANAARAIMDLSKKLQVLFFTCHPHVVDLFQLVGDVELRHLPSLEIG